MPCSSNAIGASGRGDFAGAFGALGTVAAGGERGGADARGARCAVGARWTTGATAARVVPTCGATLAGIVWVADAAWETW